MTADTFLVEGNKQEHQLSNLKPSTSYSVALYATKGPLTSGTVITNLQTRTCSFHSAAVITASQQEGLPQALGFIQNKKLGMLIRNSPPIVLDHGFTLYLK